MTDWARFWPIILVLKIRRTKLKSASSEKHDEPDSNKRRTSLNFADRVELYEQPSKTFLRLLFLQDNYEADKIEWTNLSCISTEAPNVNINASNFSSISTETSSYKFSKENYTHFDSGPN